MPESSSFTADRELTIADLNFDPPTFRVSQLLELARTHFGITCTATLLDGERDQNCRLTAADGRQYVFKVAGAGEDPEAIDFQLQALLFIAETAKELPVPRVVRDLAGNASPWIESQGYTHALRMLTYVPGIPYQDGQPPSPAGLAHIGGFLARLCQALAGFSHPAQNRFMPWDSTNDLIFRPQLKELLPTDLGQRLAPAFERLERHVVPALARLPQQVIHHDGHGANLLRESPEREDVVGVIDFGDMIHGPVICDLAASASDFLADEASPESVVAAMCAGFHAVSELTAAEAELLQDLVIARLVRILMLFEFRRRHMAQPPAFVSSDQPLYRRALERVLAVDRYQFTDVVWRTCK